MVFMADREEEREGVLQRFQRQMHFLRTSGFRPAPASGIPSVRPVVPGGFSPRSGTRGASPYAQRPLGFDQATYNEWMAQLTAPWREEDAWKSET
jgi:hypothetical protein